MTQTATTTDLTGVEIGAYRLGEPLGAPFLFKATEISTGHPVLIKVLPAWNHNEEAIGRFERELKVATRIEHENVARLLDSGRADVSHPDLVGDAAGESGTAPVYYFVREVIEGSDLKTLMQDGRVPVVRAMHVAIQVLEGLAALHEGGVLHRNIQPEGILLANDQSVKLIDFGLVKFLEGEAEAANGFTTMAGQSVGIAGYMAPEQVHGGEVDAGTDLFCVGTLLYEMVAGKGPFPTDSILAYFQAVDKGNWKPLREMLQVPEALDVVMARLLALPGGFRYPSAREAADALAACLASAEV